MRKRSSTIVSAAMVFLGSWLQSPLARAEEEARPSDTAAWRANTGLVTGLGLTLVIPSHGTVGVGGELSGRLGIPAGPLIFAPGAMLGGYFVQERFVGDLLGTVRLVLPLGPVAPFAQGGLGPGFTTNPDKGGLAWLGGGGLALHLGLIS